MTTVGYGDVFPESALGCAIGMLCAICGVILVALTIPVISNNFALFYLHARTRDSIVNRDTPSQTPVENDVMFDQNCSRLSKQSSNVTIERIGRVNAGNDIKRHWDVRAALPIIESNSTLADSVGACLSPGGACRSPEHLAHDNIDSSSIRMIDESKSPSCNVTETSVNPSADNVHV